MDDFFVEDILEQFEDYISPVNQGPGSMDQEPRNMYANGQLVQPSIDGSRPGYAGTNAETGEGFQKGHKGFGKDLKGKPSLNVAGKNQYTPKTTKEIQAIIDANPDYITPKNFYEPTNTMKQKGMKKLLTFTDTENSDVVFQRKGQPDPDPAKQTATNTKRTAAKKNLEGRIVQLKSPKGYQVHHIMPLAGNEKLNTGDYAVVSEEMNAKMSKYDRKINKLVNEAYDLDYSKTPSLKRVDEINNELFDILKTVKKDLPKEYKGLLGFNKLTPVLDTFDDQGKQVFSAEPQGIDYKKSIAGVRGDKVKDTKKSNIQDLVNKAPKFEMTKLAAIGCPGKAMGGRIGFSEGQNLTACATKGVEKLRGDPSKLSPGDQANLRALTKSGKAINFLKGVLGPAAILGEVVFEGGAAANKFMEGMPLKQALGESYLNYALGPKLKIDVEAERAKEMAKGEEYAMAERGRRKAPFMAQSAQADELRRKQAMKKMEEVYPTSSESDINLALQNADMTQQETGMTYPEIQDYIKRQDQMQAIAEAGGVSKMATGGLANLMKKYYD